MNIKIRTEYDEVINANEIKAIKLVEDYSVVIIQAKLEGARTCKLLSFTSAEDQSLAAEILPHVLDEKYADKNGVIDMLDLEDCIRTTTRHRTWKPGIRKVSGKMIDTQTEVFTSANILEAEAGTNGYCGGDSGHGSRTYIRINDRAGTDIEYRISDEEGLEIMLGGDCELETIIDTFRWIADTLNQQTKEMKYE